MTARIYTVGKRFGRLVIIGRKDKDTVVVRCDCGAHRAVSTSHLRAGQQSCGCLREEKKRRQQGMSTSPEYTSWMKMLSRCRNQNDKSYPQYGGRGIDVRYTTFQEFLGDVGQRPGPGWTIERLDVHGHYEPGNTQWILKGLQSRNRQYHLLLTYHGKTQPAWQWAEEVGIPVNTIRTRVHRGWTDEQVLTTPPQQGKKPGAQQHSFVRTTLLTYQGTTQSIRAWAQTVGLSEITLAGRLRRGWSVERALTAMPR